jgi:methanogenesis imperfect marker protein 11
MLHMTLDAPYTVTYKGIYAIANEQNTLVELIEESQCYGASAWARYHMSKGPLVASSHDIGNMMRYLLKAEKADFELIGSKQAAGIENVSIHDDEIEITFSGLGGGGVGATVTRAHSPGVLRYSISESGGGRKARGTIVLPRRERVLIGIDDTDSKEEGATWALAHNIAAKLHTPDTAYLSHVLVQLYPVEERTQNCVSTAIEFACTTTRAKNNLIEQFKQFLQKYSVSTQTGMAVYSGFDPSALREYSSKVRCGKVTKQEAIDAAKKTNTEIHLSGNGLIGAIAAIPWYAQPEESIKLQDTR